MKHDFQYMAIVAMAENRVIGYNGDIPWYLPEDFKWFKKMTEGHTVLMGRKTYDSIKKDLPNRQTIVLSSQDNINKIDVVNEISEIEKVSKNPLIWVAGGEKIYRLMLYKCTDLYLTVVHKKPKGDTFFPEYESMFTKFKTISKNKDFTIEHWKKINAPC